MTDLDSLERRFAEEIDAARDEAALEAVRLAALGKKGEISELLKGLGKMTPDERRDQGPLLNGLRDRVQSKLTEKRDALAEAAISARLAAERLDVTLPVRSNPLSRGRIHPISQVVDEITAIFADMGFSIAEGPDIETDHYNFTALNFPEGHPAREMHDTFFLQTPEAASVASCARTPRPCRCARWRRRSPRSASSSPARPIGRIPTRPTRPCSIRWKGW